MTKKIVLLAAALVAVACSDSPTEPEAPSVATVEVGPASALVEVGDTVRLSAVARTAEDAVLTAPVTWQVSDAQRATLTAQGASVRVTGVRGGGVVVRATAGGKIGEATVSVRNPAPLLDEVTPSTWPQGGGGFTLTVRGRGFSPDARIRWNGQDRTTTFVSLTELRTEITAAEIAETGTMEVRVTAPEPGGGVSGAMSVTVEPQDGGSPGPVSAVTFDVDSLALEEGEARLIVATPRDSEGREVPGLPVQWTTSDPGIAQVSVGGTVMPLRPGRATITARVHGQTASVPVRVYATYAYDLIYEVFTGSMVEVMRLDVRVEDGSPARIFPDERWAEDPVASPDGSRIAVVGNDATGARGIWIVNADGTGILEVTSGADEQPAWSPDGSRIAFRRWSDATAWDIWVVALDGSGETNLTADRGYTNQRAAAWSSTGRIAYSNQVAGEAHIWTMAADGSDKRQITSGVVWDDEPAWSPDAQRIAFARIGDIWTVNAAGGGEREVAGLPFGQFAPAWSPDGALIAFAWNDASGTSQIYTVRSEGGWLAQRTFDAEPPADGEIPPHKRNPSWLVHP